MGGGLGTAIAPSQLSGIGSEVHVIAGSETKTLLFLKTECQKSPINCVTTDDGSDEQGFVTDVLKNCLTKEMLMTLL